MVGGVYMSRPERRALPIIHREVELDAEMTVRDLGKRMTVGLRRLLTRMAQLGEKGYKPDSDVSVDVAEVMCLEFGLTPVRADNRHRDRVRTDIAAIDEDALAELPPRTAVVTVMGHVDHGKTTLLDCLRSASVADSEAGGITQAIGAFTVDLSAPIALSEGATNKAKKAAVSKAAKKGKGAGKGKVGGGGKGKKGRGKGKGGGGGGELAERITFLDTPGHALFSSMRARGAQTTDIVVLVVAADDGLMPQTRESAAVALDAGVPIVVAVTKIDVVPDPEQAISRVASELLEIGVATEAHAGDCPIVGISAVTGAGFDDFKEILKLQAEIMELKADTRARGEAVVVEAFMNKGLGPVADVVMRWGTLKVGDHVVCGNIWGRVKALLADDGTRVTQAVPAEPVRVVGLRGLPRSGEDLLATTDEVEAQDVVEGRVLRAQHQKLRETDAVVEARRAIEAAEHRREKKRARLQRMLDYRERANQRAQLKGEDVPEELLAGAKDMRAAIAKLNDESRAAAAAAATESAPLQAPLIARASSFGALAAVQEAVSALPAGEVVGKFVQAGVGDVTEGDLDLAVATGAHIFAFDVKVPAAVAKKADQLEVTVHTGRVIYHFLDTVRDYLATFLDPLTQEEVVGRAEVVAMFGITGKRRDVVGQAAGCRVLDGIIRPDLKFRVVRDGEVVGEARGLTTLKHFQEDVRQVEKGTECGITLDGFDDLQVGDRLEAVKVSSVAAKLEAAPAYGTGAGGVGVGGVGGKGYTQ